MVKRKLKFKKKKNQKIKVKLLAAGLLICCCIAISIIVPTILKKDSFYEVENKQSAIKKSLKEDGNGVKTIGWIKVQGTKIDSPIIKYEQGVDLSRLEKENYVWTEAKDEKYHNQTKIIGHNILNLSANPEVGVEYFTKFEDLMAFTYEDFVANNKYIQYTLGDKDYIYKVFAVLYDRNYNLDTYNTEDYTDEEMTKYIDYVKSKSLYSFNIETDSSDDIIVLSTCTRLFGPTYKHQFVVVGRLLRQNEKIENYGFTTTARYEEIQEIMKGETNDEEV